MSSTLAPTSTSNDVPDVPMVRVPRSASPVPTPARLRSVGFPLAAFIGTAAVLIPALILASIQLGWFGTTGRVDASTGQAITITADSVGADIRGWMTLSQLLEGLGVPRAEFDAAFPGAVGVDAGSKLGELSEAGAFELEAVRTWLDERTTAADASDSRPVTSEAGAAVAPTSNATHTPTGTPTAAPGEGDGEPPAIRGRTTVQELLDATGVSLSAFAAEFAVAEDVDPGTRLVDLVDRSGNAVAVDAVRTWADAL